MDEKEPSQNVPTLDDTTKWVKMFPTDHFTLNGKPAATKEEEKRLFIFWLLQFLLWLFDVKDYSQVRSIDKKDNYSHR
jgi:hypothetical protein